jgi:hypothetical protein
MSVNFFVAVNWSATSAICAAEPRCSGGVLASPSLFRIHYNLFENWQDLSLAFPR